MKDEALSRYEQLLQNLKTNKARTTEEGDNRARRFQEQRQNSRQEGGERGTASYGKPGIFENMMG